MAFDTLGLTLSDIGWVSTGGDGPMVLAEHLHGGSSYGRSLTLMPVTYVPIVARTHGLSGDGREPGEALPAEEASAFLMGLQTGQRGLVRGHANIYLDRITKHFFHDRWSPTYPMLSDRHASAMASFANYIHTNVWRPDIGVITPIMSEWLYMSGQVAYEVMASLGIAEQEALDIVSACSAICSYNDHCGRGVNKSRSPKLEAHFREIADAAGMSFPEELDPLDDRQRDMLVRLGEAVLRSEAYIVTPDGGEVVPMFGQGRHDYPKACGDEWVPEEQRERTLEVCKKRWV